MAREVFPGNVVNAMQLPKHGGQPAVLGPGKGRLDVSLELNAQGKIVTTRTPAPGRSAGMPGSPMEGNELGQGALPVNEKMG